MIYRTKHISKCAHTLLKYLMMRENLKTINDAMVLCYAKYVEMYPSKADMFKAPKQNPLVYGKVSNNTNPQAVNIEKELSIKIDHIPDYFNTTISKYDRIILNYQNTRDYDIPAWIRVPWLDIEYTQWEKYTPSLLV